MYLPSQEDLDDEFRDFEVGEDDNNDDEERIRKAKLYVKRLDERTETKPTRAARKRHTTEGERFPLLAPRRRRKARILFT